MDDYAVVFGDEGSVRVHVVFDSNRKLSVASRSTTPEKAQEISQMFQSGYLKNITFNEYPAQLLGIKFDDKRLMLFVLARLSD